MKKNLLPRLLVLGLRSLMISVALVTVVLSQESPEKIEKGAYSLRRAATPEYFVTGVALGELSRARFENMSRVDVALRGKWGRCLTLFRKKTTEQVKITTAVYGSVSEAENSVLDLLNDMSAVFKPGTRSGDVIGTHSWYLTSPDGGGTIVFVYNNSLFQLFSTNYSLAERSARSIVDDLAQGRNGIRLGKKVVLPKVTQAKLPARLEKGKEGSLILEGEDPYRQKLSFAVSASTGQLLDTQRRGEKIYIPHEAGSDELRVYAINELNVVSELYVKKLEVEREEK